MGLFTIQRFFIVDSHSVDTAVESIRIGKPDVVEIMPGVIGKTKKTKHDVFRFRNSFDCTAHELRLFYDISVEIYRRRKRRYLYVFIDTVDAIQLLVVDDERRKA